jgi:hypothetical protein
MLASITPLGERGRQSRWTITVTAFGVGAAAAGVALGALLGAAGEAMLGAVGARARLIVLAVLLAGAVALDSRAGGRGSIPGPRRQVNERWLDEFRGWVYGLGFGAQLGLGVTTVISSAATYAALAAGFLSGAAGRGALVLGLFGVVRGLSLLAAARVRRPDQLIALHARLERWRTPARRAVVVVMCGLLVAAVAWGAG